MESLKTDSWANDEHSRIYYLMSVTEVMKLLIFVGYDTVNVGFFVRSSSATNQGTVEIDTKISHGYFTVGLYRLVGDKPLRHEWETNIS